MNNIFEKISQVWQKVTLVQRVVLTAVVLALALSGTLLVNWMTKPDMMLLYQDLSPKEAATITEKISEKSIPYQLKNGGTTIYVPRQHVYQLRLDMAKEGLPQDKQSGYKLFDNEKIGISPFVQNVNLKRALQDELAKSIQMIDGVVLARVHIVDSEQGIFASDKGKTTASVILKLRPGYALDSVNIAAITNMVSGGVKGLKAENITIIDSQGRLLSGSGDQTVISGVGTVQSYREKIERSLAKKAEDMLLTVLGPGRATVKVSAVIDMNSTSTITETYDPTKKVSTKEEIKKTTEKPAVAAGAKNASGGSKNDSTIVTEYQVGKTVKQEVVLPGKIKSLSVAAFVDLHPADVNDANAPNAQAMIMDVNEVELIIKNALGLKPTDSLKVVNAKFRKPKILLDEEKPSKWPKYMALARNLSMGIMAVCALLVFKIFGKAKKNAAESAAQGAQLPGAPGSTGLMAPSEEPLVIRRQIAAAIKNNPEQVKQLFINWIEGQES